MSVSRLRVASVPANHAYVKHLSSVNAGDSVSITRMPDPRPDVVGGAPAGQWWPPTMLDPDWVEAHADEFDIFHIHFGFDARSPEQL